VKVPLPRLDEVTVTVEADPKHGAVALVPKLLTFGVEPTVTLAVLLAETALLQLPLAIEVMVIVVEPELASAAVLNVPLLAPIVSVAVSPVAVLAPLRL
jgi:hypothetical protein